MANKILIIHGYSDGATSFTDLRDFFIREKLYKRENIFLLNYASMDDEATFLDFADKLDADYENIFGGERIDVACHSTGALVARCWLALRRRRLQERGGTVDNPVKRLLMFAPANFGSDLAGMGQSFLGKFRSTFFNSKSHDDDFMESGRQVLQGLEPASPFQWELSEIDLHEATYFSPNDESGASTFPFVFAAGENYEGQLQAKIIAKRRKAGTDGTVRICGTSLNTRRCQISFVDADTAPQWEPEVKFGMIPFSVFKNFHHGSIVSTGAGRGDKKNQKKRQQASDNFMAVDGPGPLVKKALRVHNVEAFEKVSREFNDVSERNYAALDGKLQDRYQQFFIRVRDDIDAIVDDFFLDFYVIDANGREHTQLTEAFDEDLAPEFYVHSDDKSCRVMMVNCRRLKQFNKQLKDAQARLVLDISAVPPLPDVKYQAGRCILYDPNDTKGNRGKPKFMFPNTTTLVDIVLNRIQSSKLLHLTDHNLRPKIVREIDRRAAQKPKLTGRGQIANRSR